MSMMPRLGVFYITEVFEKYRNHDFSPSTTTQKTLGLFHGFSAAKMFLMSRVKKPYGITGFISKSKDQRGEVTHQLCA